MAADAGLVLDRGQPFRLGDLGGNIALAAELVRGGNLQHREPVDRGVILRRGRVVRRRHGGQVQMLARVARNLGRVDQPIAAHPYLIIGLRQIGNDVATLIVGDDHLGEAGRQIVRFGDHPDAGFRPVRAFDHAADVILLDRDVLSAGRKRRCGKKRGNSHRSNARIQHALHKNLPSMERGDMAASAAPSLAENLPQRPVPGKGNPPLRGCRAKA